MGEIKSRRLGVFAFFLVRIAFGQRKGWCIGLLGRLADGLLTRLAVGVLGRLLRLILRLLRLLRGHDAEIMLRMLKIILGHDAVAAGVGVTRQLQILLIDMAGRPANLDLRAAGIEGAVGIVPAATISTAAVAAAVTTTVLRPAAASA